MSSALAKNIRTDDRFAVLFITRQSNGKTQRAYGVDVKQFLDWITSDLSSVTFEDMLKYKQMLEDEYAPATAARKFTVIRSMYDFGIKTGYLKWNPASPIQTPKVIRRLADRILTKEQIRMLLDETEGRWYAFIALLYTTGLRCSEACSLEWNDIVEYSNHASLTIEGKGGKVRYVKIPLSLLDTLKDQGTSDDYVFSTRTGKHVTPSQVRKMFRSLSEKVGFDVSPHYLRHSHASHALDSGANAVLVRDTLGHGSLTTTSQYLHANPNESSSDYITIN